MRGKRGCVAVLVAFDVDGVLYSSEPFLAAAYREAIERVHALRPGSFPRVPEVGEILRYIGWPVQAILTGLFPDVSAEAIRLLYDASLDAICEHVVRGEGKVYPGVPETLRRLASEGHTLVVASNGRHRYVETVLEVHSLGRWFAPLLSLDRDGLPDKAALLRKYLERHRVGPQDVAMVGDRASDVAAAAALGCSFVGCAYGHGSRGEIEGHGPLISSFRDLPRVLAILQAQQRRPSGSIGDER